VEEAPEFVGLLVLLNTAGGDVGAVTDVLQNGAADVLVFSTPRGTMMAPFLKRLVRGLDVKAGRMVLDAEALAEVAYYENSDS
jgi:ribosomal 30S subunit maturation factor RimM